MKSDLAAETFFCIAGYRLGGYFWVRCRFIRKMRGPEGRRLNVSPAREGLCENLLDKERVPQVSLGAGY